MLSLLFTSITIHRAPNDADLTVSNILVGLMLAASSVFRLSPFSSHRFKLLPQEVVFVILDRLSLACEDYKHQVLGDGHNHKIDDNQNSSCNFKPAISLSRVIDLLQFQQDTRNQIQSCSCNEGNHVGTHEPPIAE